MILIPASCTMSWTSIPSSSGTLLDLIPWMYFSPPVYNHKGFDLGNIWMAYGFPYFLQFKSEFGNKEFMIWATVSSWSCFGWFYRFSIFDWKEYNQSDFSIDLLVMSLVLLEEGVCYDQCVLLAKLCWLLTCFILYFKDKLACYSRYLLTSYFAFQSLIMKRTSFFGVLVLKVL